MILQSRRYSRGLIACLVVVLSVSVVAARKKPAAGDASSDTSDNSLQGDAAAPAAALGVDPATIDLPPDANQASLRVSAMDTIYEMDLTVSQIRVLRAATAGTADATARTAATTTPQLLSTLKDFQTALLDGKDDQKIATLRDQLITLAGGDDVHLDDAITVTPNARANAAGAFAMLKAGQIAAYLAAHAEEITDPLEIMMGTADGLQDLRSASAADKAANGVQDPEALIQQASAAVGYLVAGTDGVKADAVTQHAAAWMHLAGSTAAADYPKHRRDLEASAKNIVSGTPSIMVLNNWMQQQMAILLSNPQLPQAIDAVEKVRM